jgi:hypothetical protein
MLWPDMCDNLGQILLTICQLFVKIYKWTLHVIFRNYLALTQAQTSLTPILIPDTSGHLFHIYSGCLYILP